MSASPSPSASPAPAPTPVAVPQRGAGTFTTAAGLGVAVGAGRVMRYRVEVEDGSGEDPAGFAAAVERTLGDPRGWTAGGRWAFQRVPDPGGTTAGGEPVDFVIKLSTPETTNAICRAGGLDPQGYTSCRTGRFVVINLARWRLAVPGFAGDLATYRQYVVNHEVGHRLGHGHARCPAPGTPAPVMQQQTLGLDGCRPNAWPYVNGVHLTGPSVP